MRKLETGAFGLLTVALLPHASAPARAQDVSSNERCASVDRFEVTPRPLRAGPYFVDIADVGAGGGAAQTRFWFNLQP